MSAGLGTALHGASAPFVDQVLVELSGWPVGPGAYVVLAGLASVVAVAGWDGRSRLAPVAPEVPLVEPRG